MNWKRCGRKQSWPNLRCLTLSTASNLRRASLKNFMLSKLNLIWARFIKITDEEFFKYFKFFQREKIKIFTEYVPYYISKIICQLSIRLSHSF
jgi:hypothetical protein